MSLRAHRPVLRRPTAAVAIVAVLAVTALALPQGPGRPTLAAAHTSVESVRPKAGSTAKTNITIVAMVFEGDTRSNKITVKGPGGTVISKATKRDPRNDRRYQTALATPVKPGKYTASWRMTAADGHKQKGSWTFTVKK
ncbi:MAG: copper resistance protein CopC [Solirubrobacteraceae bacterium]|nr:copper resistance protein CopC [Solirubrobacteraceae bacterium]